jgi:preprotein translocase subunit SecA
VEQLRQVIHLRGYGQRDPLNEYKTEGYNLFESMVNKLRETVTAQVMRVEIQLRDAAELTTLPGEDELPVMEAHHIDPITGEDELGSAAAAGTLLASRKQRAKKTPNAKEKVGRNDPCPCGSGKRYKHCHGAYA